MNIIEVAEFLSAFAAFITVCLAVVELASRRRVKSAERAIEVYADYLFADQQIKYLMGSAASFTEKCGGLQSKERQSYAKTNMPDPSLFALIRSIEKESISEFECDSVQGKRNAKVILQIAGAASNFLLSLKIFYQAILDQEDYPVDRIQKNFQLVSDTYQKLSPFAKDAEKLLRKNLKELHRSSNTYLVALAISACLFFALCLILHHL